jgi:CRP-like cAMP-binding protein
MSENNQPKQFKNKDLAKPIMDRIEEAKTESEIVGYKGTPNMPTKFKSRDKHRARLICYLKAIGFKNKDIAAAVGGTVEEVYRVIRSESAQSEIERVQQEIFVHEPAKMFETILPQAVRIAVSAMMSRKTKASVRVDAAFKFMDRALGKPTQPVEHSTNLVKELITKLNDSVPEPPLDADFFVVQNEPDKDGDK